MAVSNGSAGKSVCVIGAGVSGLATARHLQEAGIPFECFDERESAGGIWAYTEQRGITCAWRGLNQNSPRGTYEFRGFPMPDRYGLFPSADETCEYLNAFVDHVGFRDSLRLGQRVEHVAPSDNGWEILIGTGERRRFSSVVIANGHHNQPYVPETRGTFEGETIHSQAYRCRNQFEGKRVLVVGFGNSASQIAVDVSHAAERTLLSVRRGAWVLPHFIRGTAYNAWLNPPPWWVYRYVPRPLLNATVSAGYRVLLGSPGRFGLPEPDHRFGESLPTVCEGLYDRLGNGRISIKPAIDHVDELCVTFADGTSETVDTIVWATGYRIDFPFLDPSIIATDENRLPLFLNTFLPGRPGLAFVGAFQAIAPGFVAAYESQAELVAASLCGDYALPDVGEMQRRIARDQARMASSFLKTPRNQSQVNASVFIHECQVELRHGRKRARDLDSRTIAGGAPVAHASSA